MQFSIVSYLDSEATLGVRDLQRKISDVTGSKASLTSWEPHITVGDGVEVRGASLEDITQELTRMCHVQEVFQLRLAGFSSFDSRPLGKNEASTAYALFLEVEAKQQLLDFVKQIGVITSHYNKWYNMSHPYIAHVTLAFRDLDKEGFDKGLKYLSTMSLELITKIDHLALVEKLENKDTEYQRFKFGIKS